MINIEVPIEQYPELATTHPELVEHIHWFEGQDGIMTFSINPDNVSPEFIKQLCISPNADPFLSTITLLVGYANARDGVLLACNVGDQLVTFVVTTIRYDHGAFLIQYIRNRTLFKSI